MAVCSAAAGIGVAGATDAARAAADVVLLAPGLSVIVDAIRLAREIFARMTSYAIYRVAETIRVLLLVVLLLAPLLRAAAGHAGGTAHLAGRVGELAGIASLCYVVIAVLMVWQPGN